MKKILFLTAVSLVAAEASLALTTDEQLKAMKEVFVKEFQKMDDDGDGTISKSEYLAHQFETFRANIIEADGFSVPQKKSDDIIKNLKNEVEDTAIKAKSSDVELGGVSPALKEMAEFEVDIDGEPLLGDEEEEAVDAVINENDSIKTLLENMSQDIVINEEAAAEENKSHAKPKDQMELMLDAIRKNLPKKIDEITSWIDIEYKDNLISYIYQADVDMASYSDAEKTILQNSIKEEACMQAYTDMCPKVKPMFIDEGINMRIKYLDKNKQEINSCEFNKETCQ